MIFEMINRLNGKLVEAILSLGMPDQKTKPHDLPEIAPEKVHRERY